MAKPKLESAEFKGWRWLVTQGFGENLAMFANVGLDRDSEVKPSMLPEEFMVTKLTTLHFFPEKKEVRTIPYFVEYLDCIDVITWFRRDSVPFISAATDKLIVGLEASWSGQNVKVEPEQKVQPANADVQKAAEAELKMKTSLFKALRNIPR